MFGWTFTFWVLFALGVTLSVWGAIAIWHCLFNAWHRGRQFARFVFLAAATGAVLYGGAKSGATGRVMFPSAESQVEYLVDDGSYVTNDYVYINFTRRIVPDSAKVYIDYYPVGSTNIAEECVTHLATYFSDLTLPHIVYMQAATNYNWLVYTDWTPGPAVVTNGVWHTYWMTDRDDGETIVPVRSIVIEGGKRILPNPEAFSDADIEKLNAATAVSEGENE